MPPVSRKPQGDPKQTPSRLALRLMMPAPPVSGGAGVPATAATGHSHCQETRSWVLADLQR